MQERFKTIPTLAMLLLVSPMVWAGDQHPPVTISMTLDGDRKYQTIDGFGANINPDQWEHGHLQQAFDWLVDDLGGTLFRFDCFGTADWLDPNRRDEHGHFPAAYLKEVYTSRPYQNAWQALRYLTSKRVKVFLNVSGRIPAGLAEPDGNTLKDFAGYAEMVVSQLRWAREQENLGISLLSPFNETDIGRAEGPRIHPAQCLPAVRAVIEKLDEAGMKDVRLVLMDETGTESREYIEELVKEPSLADRMVALATHQYGNQVDDGDGFTGRSRFAQILARTQGTPFQRLPLWLGEYGDLDQSGVIEFTVGWLSTQRLLKTLEDGVAAGLVWDGYDNFHKHDALWSAYGLLATDQSQWTYTRKSRFYAARQVYRFVPPGFQRIDLRYVEPEQKDKYTKYKTPMRHRLVLAFLAPDGNDCSIVGMCSLEHAAKLNLDFKGVPKDTLKKSWTLYRTSRRENCVKVGEFTVPNGTLELPLTENSIFTLTTLQ
jgi:hypothetical protein